MIRATQRSITRIIGPRRSNDLDTAKAKSCSYTTASFTQTKATTASCARLQLREARRRISATSLLGTVRSSERLQELTKELHLNDIVQMTGWLPKPEDVNIALNAGDIGLVMRVGHASDDFHMTGALVHSMAVGLPILGAQLGGVSEVVHDGIQGYLFPQTI
ncbi:MAG: glycosyltransferase [Kiritimatiellae bacterium]|nr:glycosyltransferase [Kiritimatiellia bacterium]